MLKVIARIFDDNQLVGYLLTDGRVEKPVTREQAWKYAKNKMIENVVAVGSANVQTPFGASNSASLSGKNGFELKSLPKIEEVCNSNEIYEMKEELRDNGNGYTIEERELLISILIKIRKAMDKPKLDAMKNAIREQIYSEPDVTDSMSQYVTVIAILYDSKCEEINRKLYTNVQKKRKIIGYRIKYTGFQPMIFTRSPKGKEYWPYDIDLKNNGEYDLNLKEITLLASRKGFNLEFSNGKVRQLSRKTLSLEEQLENYRVEFDDKVPEIDIRTCDTEENIYKIFDTMNTYRNLLKQLKSNGISYESSYFFKLQGLVIENTEDKNRVIFYLEEVLGEKKVNGSEQKLKQANSPKGIFDAFKR